MNRVFPLAAACLVLVAGCNSDGDRTTTRSTSTTSTGNEVPSSYSPSVPGANSTSVRAGRADGTLNPNGSMSNTGPNANRSSTGRSGDANNGNWNADEGILSFLHAKNREEIEMGRMAAQHGQSQEVRDYGQRLVSDHTSNDSDLQRLAQSMNVTLREPGRADMDNSMSNMSGERFDRSFADKMASDHREVIRRVEDARSATSNDKVRAYLDNTLQALRNHEKMASQLPR